MVNTAPLDNADVLLSTVLIVVSLVGREGAGSARARLPMLLGAGTVSAEAARVEVSDCCSWAAARPRLREGAGLKAVGAC